MERPTFIRADVAAWCKANGLKSAYDFGPVDDRSAEKPLSAKERLTAQKLIIGLAVKGYGFDPKRQRSEVPPKIARDLGTLGLQLDEDTVRRWLKDAAELLPPLSAQGTKNPR
jgi:hypothetical protein